MIKTCLILQQIMMKANLSEGHLQADILAAQQISVLPSILNVICRITGLGFAAVARVTETRWITCLARDEINFGLKPGDELKVETTICNEIRQSHKQVIIDDVDKDAIYCNHHTPALYGFKSYISVPIFKKDGSFFGTLCAIDPAPAKIDTPAIKDMFRLFAELIAFHLQMADQLEETTTILWKERAERANLLEKKNAELQISNAELESFTYIASHDLKEPLRKIQTFSGKLLDSEADKLSDNGRFYFSRMLKSVSRMQQLIDDLLTYSRINLADRQYKETKLADIVEEIKQDYKDTPNKPVTIEMGEMCCFMVVPFQVQQLFQNLISNAVKFSKPGIHPVIHISSVIEKGSVAENDKLDPVKDYCHITVSDNGIGFNGQYANDIFKIFKRLHGNNEYEGTGIGLAIVKKIVDNHHGCITVHSKEGEGARFDIYLPQELI